MVVRETHNRYCWNDLHHVWRQSSIHSPEAFVSVGPQRDIPHARIGLRMLRGSLGLKPCPEQIEGIHNTSSEAATGRTNTQSHPDGQLHLPFIALPLHCRLLDVRSLQVLKSAQVYGGIREDADQSQGETPVEAQHPSVLPRLGESFRDELVSTRSVIHDLALHATAAG